MPTTNPLRTSQDAAFRPEPIHETTGAADAAAALARTLRNAQAMPEYEASALDALIARGVASHCAPPTSSVPDEPDNAARYYFLTQTDVSRIARRPIDPPAPKRYLGFDRVTRSLRHVAIAVNMTMRARFDINPLEVQVSVFGGRMHIASNFHAGRIPEALHLALTDDSLMMGAPRRQAREDIRNWDAMVMSRRVRHIARLRRHYVGGHGLQGMHAAARAEVMAGIGRPSAQALPVDSVLRQLDDAFDTLRRVLQDAASAKPTFRDLVVHTPMQDNTPKLAVLPDGVTQTMHAEQCIESAIARHVGEWHREATSRLGLPDDALIAVPMAGRFVPCAACAEVEAQSRTQGGLFDPANGKFVLHRSSQRIGMAFANEVQHIAQSTLASTREVAANRAQAISDRFVDAPQSLRAYDQPVVLDYSLDTESESSGDES
ncbi:hypothetical protein [Pandoraea sputorum]|uniref:Uncharacterized protein n=1 Tax=Pandoraea sputorum TaxID=93222 RepID=A0A239S631_9BURK|nr:hypothetical protein [Pandoraea sputorum]SNU80881.1 Uncharacterised protein [Pandoraea sputorum]VVD74384.1 hypothetical protein PSP20601_00776 [Pandoraea sputorum]